MKVSKYLASSPRGARTLGNLQPSKQTRVYRPPGEAARERRQREATAALAQLFQPKR